MQGKEYNGVPHILDLDFPSPVFIFKHGRVSGGRHGIWQMGLQKFEGRLEDCGCSDVRSHGKAAPHIYFRCPHCGHINADHRGKEFFSRTMSINCKGCDRHLWVRLQDWDGKYWDRAMKERKNVEKNQKA